MKWCLSRLAENSSQTALAGMIGAGAMAATGKITWSEAAVAGLMGLMSILTPNNASKVS